MPLLHQLALDDVLNILDEHPLFLFPLNIKEDILHFPLGGPLAFLHFGVRLADRDRDLVPVVIGDCAVPLDHLHRKNSPCF